MRNEEIGGVGKESVKSPRDDSCFRHSGLRKDSAWGVEGGRAEQ